MTRGQGAVGFVGTGFIAEYHAKALSRLPGVRLVAVCDRAVRRAERFAASHGIPRAYEDLRLMLEDESLEAVHVLVPPEAHREVAAQALESGCDVLLEKPMCSTTEECQVLRTAAEKAGRTVGTSHNFLFSPAFEQLEAWVREGRLGRLRDVDIVWRKALPQLRHGPFGGWLFARPGNPLIELGPHVVTHALRLVDSIDDLRVVARDPVALPNGRRVPSRWEILGWAGVTRVSLSLDLREGYPEHGVHVRGTRGRAVADLANGLLTFEEHGGQPIEIDRWWTSTRSAVHTAAQSQLQVVRAVRWKLGVSGAGTGFPESVSRSVEAFHRTRSASLDKRLAAGLAEAAVALCERFGNEADWTPAEISRDRRQTTGPRTRSADVLVLGGTGFIGRALVRRLHDDGHGVRLLVRDPDRVPEDFRERGLDLRHGDLSDPGSVDDALEGVRFVCHLARAQGDGIAAYRALDVEPTRTLAEACLVRGVERVIYTSSIALYYAGAHAGLITERTEPDLGVLRCNAYAQAKFEIEQLLLDLHSRAGLPIVIFRPGVVLGTGADPRHWGVGAWPYPSVCRIWGSGATPLPIVLVDDVADALVRGLAVPDVEGEAFNLVGPPLLSAQAYLDALERVSGLSFRRMHTPTWRIYAEEVSKWLLKTLARVPGRMRPSWRDAEGRAAVALYDITKARDRLGWRPTADRERVVREGIEQPAREMLS